MTVLDSILGQAKPQKKGLFSSTTAKKKRFTDGKRLLKLIL